MEALSATLRSSRWRRALIVSDSVFGMDADSAPLPALQRVARDHGAMLMLDESHALGVLGPHGGGLAEASGLAGQVDIVMGTLFKAFGSAGGFIAAPTTICDLLPHRVRRHIFDRPPAPAAVGAAIAALDARQ